MMRHLVTALAMASLLVVAVLSLLAVAVAVSLISGASGSAPLVLAGIALAYVAIWIGKSYAEMRRYNKSH